MEFVETAVFTRRAVAMGLEEELHALQLALRENPTLGPVEAGTGGLHKVRMPDWHRSQGKRGGTRVHYLALPHRHRIYLVFVYRKDESDALSEEQKKQLRAVVERIRSTP